MVGRVKVRVGLRPSCLMADVATWKRMSLKVAVRLRIAAAPLVVLGTILPRASTNAAADVMVMVCPAIVPGSRGGRRGSGRNTCSETDSGTDKYIDIDTVSDIDVDTDMDTRMGTNTDVKSMQA